MRVIPCDPFRAVQEAWRVNGYRRPSGMSLQSNVMNILTCRVLDILGSLREIAFCGPIRAGIT